MIVFRPRVLNIHLEQAAKNRTLEVFLSGSRDLDTLLRRLQVAAARRPDQAAGLLAARAGLLSVLWPDGPAEAGVGAA